MVWRWRRSVCNYIPGDYGVALSHKYTSSQSEVSGVVAIEILFKNDNLIMTIMKS